MSKYIILLEKEEVASIDSQDFYDRFYILKNWNLAKDSATVSFLHIDSIMLGWDHN